MNALKIINRWTFLCMLLVLSVLCILSMLFFRPFSTPVPLAENPTALFLVIPAPTLTPTVDPISLITPTVYKEIIDGISVDCIVKINGTQGAGLRLRTAPGTQADSKFIAMDDELFTVQEGPEELDGYIWWFLQSPYDDHRSGWAVSAYLGLVENSNP